MLLCVAVTPDSAPRLAGREPDVGPRGYGRCSRCPCAGFEGHEPNEVCTNCGHHYTDHW